MDLVGILTQNISYLELGHYLIFYEVGNERLLFLELDHAQ
jgi:hypothetical protein